jgi:hypothetical protein
MPFGEYENFDDCVRKNADKSNPEAYCAKIKRQIEGKMTKVSATMKVQVEATDEPNVFRAIGAVPGSKCFTASGKKLFFTEEALRAYSHTWTGGIITLNHEYPDDGEIVKAEWIEDVGTLFHIKLDNEVTSSKVKAGEEGGVTGVSIEANVIDLEGEEEDQITAFEGTGIGIIFYPEQPACPLRDGCGILAKNQYDSKMATASEKRTEKVQAAMYDLGRRNNEGIVVKIDEFVTWEDGTQPLELEKEIVDFVKWVGEGEFFVYPATTLEIGDSVPIGVTEVMTVNIDITTNNGGISTMTDTVPKADFEALKAELEVAQAKLAESENVTLESVKDKLTASDAEVKQLKAEVAARDEVILDLQTTITAGMIEEIKASVPDFDPEGKSLEVIKEIHAFASKMKPAEPAKASEQDPSVTASDDDGEEPVKAGNFTAPTGTPTGGLSIGGIGGNGKWVGAKVVPASARNRIDVGE